MQLIKDIKKTVVSFDEVKGAYDLILHNYGPETYNGSIHVEVDDKCSITRLDELTRSIMKEVYKKHGVILTAVGVYSINTEDEKVKSLKKEIEEIVLSHEFVKQLHGFFYSKNDNSIRFDVVISFDAPSRAEVYKEVVRNVMKEFPQYKVEAVMDTDFSEYVENE